MKKIGIISVLVTAVFSISHVTEMSAQPPTPPKGKVWVINPEMTDEFDANSPGKKWRVYEQGSSWDRTAAFDGRALEPVRVMEDGRENYYLNMNPMWYFEDEVFTNFYDRTYYFAGGALDTRATQTYGYFEVRIKPSNFPMGSGVFMHSRYLTQGACSERYSTELDIIENMGYNGPGYSPTFNNKMNVNSHTKFHVPDSDCSSGEVISSHGEVEGKPLNEPLGFNTVGMWWEEGGTDAHFYLDGEYFGTINPGAPHTLPMPLIIVMETYVWGDDDENNAGNPKPVESMWSDDFRTREERAVSYDWVRTWKLADIDTLMYADTMDNVGFLEEPVTAYPDSNLHVVIVHSATSKRDIRVTLFDTNMTELCTLYDSIDPGIHSFAAFFPLGSIPSLDDKYKIVCDIRESGGDETSIIKSDTALLSVVSKPITTSTLGHLDLPETLMPATSYTMQIDYEAAGDMQVMFELRDGSGTWKGGGSSGVVNGKGTATVQVNLTGLPANGPGYYFKAYIKPYGSHWRESRFGFVTAPFWIGDKPTPNISIAEHSFPIFDTDTEATAGIDHSTPADAKIRVQFTDSLNNIISESERLVREGERILNFGISLDSMPEHGKNYQLIASMESANGEFEKQTDTIRNLEIKEFVPVAVTGVEVKPDTAQMNPGDIMYVKAEVFPEDAANKNISWKTRNGLVVSVTSTGIMKAIYAGETAVVAIAEDGGLYDSCVVIVTNPGATGIEIPGGIGGENDIRIIPNPVASSFRITGVQGVVDLQIYNIAGKKVLHLRDQKTTDEISIHDLTKGIYILKIITKHRLFTGKIIKQ